MSEFLKYLQWRRTFSLVALVVLMLSLVFQIRTIDTMLAFWSSVAGVISTIILFAIALLDWYKSAVDAKLYDEFQTKVTGLEQRLSDLEGRFDAQGLPLAAE